MLHQIQGGVPDPLTQCVGALVIAAGECQETLSSEGKGCDAYATKDSGVFQLDFLRSGQIGVRVRPQIEKDGGIMNLCISAFGAGLLQHHLGLTRPRNKLQP